MTWLFAIAGASAGVLQARWLYRDATGGASAWSWMLRLLLIGTVLVLAARYGSLLAGAAGWASGFVGAATLTWWSRT